MQVDLDNLVTEQRNPDTMNIDRVSTLEMLQMINREDYKVADAVGEVLEPLARAVDLAAKRICCGGRLIYCGTGTSGRLGVLDASECPPTYGVSPDLVIGIIAGGPQAIFCAQEGAEDNETLCVEDLKKAQFNSGDTLVGIAASGRTPYVIGGLQYGNKIGALTISVSCNPGSEMEQLAQIPLTPVVGPEAITGSTRMKSGTAQKMILNMLSTGIMIRLGKVYENLMIDLQANNHKLEERARHIVMETTGVDYNTACDSLEKNQYNVKLSILCLLTDLSSSDAIRLLQEHNGNLAVCLAHYGAQR